MLKELLPYYERELTYLRKLSGEFARRYPKIARRLLIDENQSEDPHVERIMEGFAFLTARIHRKLDDEFPEISEAFLQVLYPHYTQPFPSCTILQMELSPNNPEISEKVVVPRHHPALSPAIGDHQCQFRTCYPTDLLPIRLTSARLQLTQNSDHLRRLCPSATAAISLQVQTLGGLHIGKIGLDKLRFYLDGDPGLMALLFEILVMGTMQVRVTDAHETPSQTLILPGSSVSPVGFANDETLINFDNRTFAGYRLLSEYFSFPEKFLFIDIGGLDHPALSQVGNEITIQIFLRNYAESESHNRLAQNLNAANFKLGCTPAINLFEQHAEPLRISHNKTSYPVIADTKRQRAFEVISIDSVVHAEKGTCGESTEVVPPFYSIQHHHCNETPRYYWYAKREPSVLDNDNGTDMEIAFVDCRFSPTRPELEVLSLKITSSNRDLPEQLPFGGNPLSTHTDFTLFQFPVVKRIRPLRKPTAAIRPPNKSGLYWRLISHLSLNHLSIVSQGKDALQEMLTLYNLTQSQRMTREIQGIMAIDSQAATTLVTSKHFSGFVRGIDISLTIDESAFVGSSPVLFGSVLERFFALYCSPNSFTRLILRSHQLQQEIARWPARAGEALVI